MKLQLVKIINPNDRIGVKGLNRFGSQMIVEEYISPRDIWVKFVETGIRIHTTWRNFIIGNVRHVYDRTIYGIGYIGEGDYKVTINGEYTPQYKSWSRMFQRCYGEKHHKLYPTYKDCSVSEEWHNYQTFAKWYDENYYEVDGEKISLDKDILDKGNKVYSPKTCIFVPQFINCVFLKSDARRGENPIGVYLNFNFNNKYRARCSDEKGKEIDIGHYDTAEEAFQAYKNVKEKVIKNIADKYKNKIPFKLFTAMINYKVDIED